MIKAHNITLGYNETIVPIKNFSFDFLHGVYYIRGISGSGKSTLLLGLAGLMTPISGRIEMGSEKIAMVFQESRLVTTYSAEQNLSLVCSSGDDIKDALSKVELSEFAKKPVCKLSGGQARRVAIARALCYGGDCIIMDEPFEGLDAALRKRIAVHIRTRFPLIIIASHDEQDAKLLSEDGKLTEIFLDDKN